MKYVVPKVTGCEAPEAETEKGLNEAKFPNPGKSRVYTHFPLHLLKKLQNLIEKL